MSVEHMAIVFDIEDMTPTDKLLLLALADHADEDGYCWPGVPRLARRVGVSERRVQQIMAELVKGGYVVRLLQAAAGRDGQIPLAKRTNLYQLTLDGVKPISPPPVKPVSPPGVKPISPKPSLEPPLEPSAQESSTASSETPAPQAVEEDGDNNDQGQGQGQGLDGIGDWDSWNLALDALHAMGHPYETIEPTKGEENTVAHLTAHGVTRDEILDKARTAGGKDYPREYFGECLVQLMAEVKRTPRPPVTATVVPTFSERTGYPEDPMAEIMEREARR